MLYLQWKVSRWGVLALGIMCLALPVLILRVKGVIAVEPTMVREGLILAQRSVTVMWPALAVVAGLTFAMTAWSWDHSGKHVYALTLPLPRWEYVLLKLGAGVAMMSIP